MHEIALAVDQYNPGLGMYTRIDTKVLAEHLVHVFVTNQPMK
jgi:hypothetical protein